MYLRENINTPSRRAAPVADALPIGARAQSPWFRCLMMAIGQKHQIAASGQRNAAAAAQLPQIPDRKTGGDSNCRSGARRQNRRGTEAVGNARRQNLAKPKETQRAVFSAGVGTERNWDGEARHPLYYQLWE